MVAQLPLEEFVMVRIHVGQPLSTQKREVFGRCDFEHTVKMIRVSNGPTADGIE